jgi:16S rRNA (guanine966-N2)-methyltransferase
VRIVGGRWAGRDLTSPGGRVRPTAEQIRIEWMELLGPRLSGARLLELYAGTGAVGLEALSRGARSADFVENNPAALHALKANVAALRASSRTRIFKQDALRYVGRLPAGAYDIALADPPYGSKQTDRLIERWLDIPFAAALALEHAADHRLPGGARTRVVGDTAVSLYTAPAA